MDTNDQLEELRQSDQKQNEAIARIEGAQAESKKEMRDLVTKLDLLIMAGVKTQATWDALLLIIKASPVAITVISVILGGIVYLIKHA